jgi:cytochrome c
MSWSRIVAGARVLGRTLVLAAVAASAPLAASAQDAPGGRRGELLFIQCKACHSVSTAAEGKIGPPLGGVIGRQAAAVPGFGYSKALAGAGLTWDDATLDRWLAQPSALVPGTTMVFAGVAKPDDRQQLIAYLKRATAPAP